MDTLTPRKVEYYNLTDVVNAVSDIRHVKKLLIEAVSHSDFTFGTNAYTLIGMDELTQVWYNENHNSAADKALKTFGSYALVNLEG